METQGVANELPPGYVYRPGYERIGSVGDLRAKRVTRLRTDGLPRTWVVGCFEDPAQPPASFGQGVLLALWWQFVRGETRMAYRRTIERARALLK